MGNNDMHNPSFTIVIPTRDRMRPLGNCLRSLAALDFPSERFEVIIVEDGSLSISQQWAERICPGIRLRLLHQRRGGAAAARNTGLRKAGGDYVVFIDDDCRATPSWLTRIEAAVAVHPEAGIGGSVINGLPENLFSEASQMIVSYMRDHHNQKRKSAAFYTSNNIAFPIEPLRHLGGFDVTFKNAGGEDRELCHRWLRNGYKLLYEPTMRVVHFSQLNLFRFIRQQYNYGKGAATYRTRCQEKWGEAVDLESMDFYLKLILYSRRSGKTMSHSLTALLCLSQIINAFGFFRVSLPSRLHGPIGVGSNRGKKDF